jgi:hypothetical protein
VSAKSYEKSIGSRENAKQNFECGTCCLSPLQMRGSGGYRLIAPHLISDQDVNLFYICLRITFLVAPAEEDADKTLVGPWCFFCQLMKSQKREEMKIHIHLSNTNCCTTLKRDVEFSFKSLREATSFPHILFTLFPSLSGDD